MEERRKGRIAVFFGGESFEHEISILTGVFVLNVLKGAYDLLPVYIDMDGDFYTSPKMFSIDAFTAEKKKFTRILFVRDRVYRFGRWGKELMKIDCALNCCHGGMGEGGGIAALMDLYGIPLASPGVPQSGVFIDKTLTKPLVAGMGIPFLPYATVSRADVEADGEGECARIAEEVGFPLILKPARLGSSIGIRTVHTAEELPTALTETFAYDSVLLAEEYLPDKRDINCAAYRDRGKIVVSECEEALSEGEILSFREKYLANGGKSRRVNFPADIPEPIAREIREMTERLYRELRFSGIVRADFLLSGNRVYFNEMNTVPGSLAYYLFTTRISDARKLFIRLIEDTMSGTKMPKAQKTDILKGLQCGCVK